MGRVDDLLDEVSREYQAGLAKILWCLGSFVSS